MALRSAVQHVYGCGGPGRFFFWGVVIFGFVLSDVMVSRLRHKLTPEMSQAKRSLKRWRVTILPIPGYYATSSLQQRRARLSDDSPREISKTPHPDCRYWKYSPVDKSVTIDR